MTKTILDQFIAFRSEKIALLNLGKIDPEEFHDYIYGFLFRTKIKPTVKPKNRKQALQSYYYWISYIERKIVTEDKMIRYNIGSISMLKESLRILLKRQDKIVLYITKDLKEEVVSIYAVSDVIYKITTKSGLELTASSEIIGELSNKVTNKIEAKSDTYTNFFLSRI